MLYDRPYMRSNSFQTGPSMLKILLIANVAVFILQAIVTVWFKSNLFINIFALSLDHLKSGFVWTPITYAFLHDSYSIFHILFNCLIIFFIGRILEPVIGPRKLLALYLISALLGGVAWLLVHMWHPHGVLIGASAAALGMLIYFCCLQPNTQMTFLLFFIIPVNMKPKWLAWGLLAFEGFSFLLSELPGSATHSIANSAHLGGMLGGWLCFRYLLNDHSTFWGSVSITKPQWMKTKGSRKASKANFTVNMTSRAELQSEVDRILDKINKKGFGALNKDEKETLDKAKELLK